MHGMDPQDEITYWRDQARHWQAELAAEHKRSDQIRRDYEENEALALKSWQSKQAEVEQLREQLATAQYSLANERQVVADLREQVGLVRRYIDEIEHDVLVTVQYRKARDSGGQHVGTGGKLGGAMPSTLVYLERLVRDLKGALDGAKR